MTFRLVNGTDSPVSLGYAPPARCQVQAWLHPCDAPDTAIALAEPVDLCSCARCDNHCPSCAYGECFTELCDRAIVTLQPGASHEVQFEPRSWNLAESSCEGNPSCALFSPLPAGEYRMRVPVYDSESAATNAEPDTIAETRVQLPAEGGLVTVELVE